MITDKGKQAREEEQRMHIAGTWSRAAALKKPDPS